MKASALTIGELASRFGLPAHVLRYWESEGLLTPRRQAGQRRYGPQDVRRIALILLAREAGFGVRQLQTLLSTPDPMAHTDLLREHVRTLERRIADAQAAKALIEHALECPNAFQDCSHARERIDSRIPPQLLSTAD
ncbi:MerR family transcriptional regulator [Nocardia sp. ET3-3]|uniref:MerR family transcriptional regulator n=1 Tax=Nocardia terrae TaxID=2675851 RepID=A0A7K1VAW4_9NOCA|nr:MerR family transcriptional regulator [Nocardia terrae]MVU83793.1 MerR family transcriptional regulator [Nocardia terrae]